MQAGLSKSRTERESPEEKKIQEKEQRNKTMLKSYLELTIDKSLFIESYIH